MGSLYYRDVLSPAAVVDRLAAKAPHDVWVKEPLSSNDGPMIWRDISWLQLKRAVDSMACWMENKLGLGGGDEPVAYVGVNDIRFPIVMMAALKCGYKVRPLTIEVCFGCRLTTA
jgi:acyl-CoA synthetase (AMP-forming)/AMP-acid ligase II